ncbi:MAG: PH domain-containing protein [Candidatus Saccharibacteria bacterium]
MSHKYFADQFEDEEVLFVFRKHPIVMRKGLIFGAACLLIGPVFTLILTYTRPNNPPTLAFLLVSFLVSAVLGAIVYLPRWIAWFFSVYIVTDRRFIQISQKGLFHKSVVDMALNQIQMVNYEVAGLQQTLFGFGTIIMQTFVGDLIIHEVHHPATIQKKLLEVLRTDGGVANQTAENQGELEEELNETEA